MLKLIHIFALLANFQQDMEFRKWAPHSCPSIITEQDYDLCTPRKTVSI